MAKRAAKRKTPPKANIAPAADSPPIQGKFKPEYVRIAAKIAELGGIDRQIAEALQINVQTFHAWKVTHPELSKALKPAKQIADDNVVRSLYNRAVGYSFDSEELFVDRLGVEHRMTTVKHVPPDTTAQIFWLKNRRPDEWRDRNQIDVNLTSPEDLRAKCLAAIDRLRIVSEQGSSERAA